MRNSPLTIIIVSFNTRDLLRSCLTSLGECLQAYDVVVVDNNSHDQSSQMVAREFPRVRLVENRENLGFAGANNQIIASTASEFMLLLNSDTLVRPRVIHELLAFMTAHPTAGACSPLLVMADGKPQPFAFGNDPSLPYLLRRGLIRILFNRGLHDWGAPVTRAVDWVSGACLMTRRKAILQAGLLDEQFFMYFEDNDWCRRFRNHGWQVFYVPRLQITHVGGCSFDKKRNKSSTYYKSLEYFYTKHYGRGAGLLLRAALGVYQVLRRTKGTYLS